MVVHEVFTPRKRPKNSQESAQACVFENSSGAQAGAPRAEGVLSLPTRGDWMAGWGGHPRYIGSLAAAVYTYNML